MKDWAKIKTLEEFSEPLKGLKKKKAPAEAKKSDDLPELEYRSAPRKPLVAKIYMANHDSVVVAMCRDISVGGMQVLTDHIPGPVGTKIRINVCPAEEKLMKPFVAEGEIVRMMEDGRGFSFRFQTLDREAEQAIEQYIT